MCSLILIRQNIMQPDSFNMECIEHNRAKSSIYVYSFLFLSQWRLLGYQEIEYLALWFKRYQKHPLFTKLEWLIKKKFRNSGSNLQYHQGNKLTQFKVSQLELIIGAQLPFKPCHFYFSLLAFVHWRDYKQYSGLYWLGTR